MVFGLMEIIGYLLHCFPQHRMHHIRCNLRQRLEDKIAQVHQRMGNLQGGSIDNLIIAQENVDVDRTVAVIPVCGFMGTSQLTLDGLRQCQDLERGKGRTDAKGS